jgi:site-specific recombinase XerD
MAYSITPILHQYKDSKGLQALMIRVIYNRQYAYTPLHVKLSADQLQDNLVVNHPHKTKINAMLRAKISELEGEILDLMKQSHVSLDDLKRAAGNHKTVKDKFTTFMEEYISEVKGGKKADATIQVYQSLVDELIEYDPHLYFHKINITWLNRFEQHQRKLWEINTVHKKMKNVKGMLRRACEKGLIKNDKFEAYKVPTYEQPIPAYLEETEIAQFKTVCDSIQRPMMKVSGYYFLLSCYAGYRISDFKKFNYGTMVSNNKILLKTKKNKRIISMPIHTRLAEVLDFCKQTPFSISEQNARDYVKDIAKLAGVDRKIKVHTARHSFAMLLMDNGFDLEEVAELLGVTMKTAAIYARISNKRLEKKVLDRLG